MKTPVFSAIFTLLASKHKARTRNNLHSKFHGTYNASASCTLLFEDVSNRWCYYRYRTQNLRLYSRILQTAVKVPRENGDQCTAMQNCLRETRCQSGLYRRTIQVHQTKQAKIFVFIEYYRCSQFGFLHNYTSYKIKYQGIRSTNTASTKTQNQILEWKARGWKINDISWSDIWTTSL